MEIYNDCIRDLLCSLPDEDCKSVAAAKKPIKQECMVVTEVQKNGAARINDTHHLFIQDGSGQVTVKGLTVKTAKNEEEALNMLFEVTNKQTNN